jgi:hypothetical protein
MFASILLFAALLSPTPQQKSEPMAAAVSLRPVPDQAVRENQRLATKLSPPARSKVQSAAAAVRAAMNQQPQMTQDQLQSKARATVIAAFPGLSGMDIDSAVFLVMMQATQDQDADLQQALKSAQQVSQEKQPLRKQQQAGQLDDISAGQQLRLQMEMDQRSKLLEALSNLMKSASNTQTSIIGNLK